MTESEGVPEPPRNVRAVRDDQVFPLEIVYTGFYEGAHQWTTVTPVSLEGETHVLMDFLPAHTQVNIRAVDDDGGQDGEWGVRYNG